MKGNGSEISQAALYRISAVMLLVGAVIVTAGNLLGPQGGARAAVADAACTIRPRSSCCWVACSSWRACQPSTCASGRRAASSALSP